MGLTDDFWIAVADAVERPEMAGPHLLTTRLSWAAARTLRAEGVGLSLSANPDMRVPLGASSEDASTAERLQFTAGEGPCLDAYAQHEPVMATEAVIGRSWPMFADQFYERTPFRSVLAVPLGRLGAVDVYFDDPQGCTLLAMGEVLLVVQQILTAILDERLFSAVAGEALWTSLPARRRGLVSVAMGMVSVALEVTQGEALSVLRAHAFTHDAVLEDVASRLVEGSLPTRVLMP